MEYIIAIVIVLVLFFAYAYKQGLDWEKQYKIEIGKYYKLSPEQSAKQDNFNGTCYFDEMISPIDAGIRMPKGEKIFVVINNLSLMAYKSTGNFKFGGVFFRQKIAPALYLRAGTGKLRTRKYKKKIGPLIIVSKETKIINAAKNISGVEVVDVKKLNIELLAPGAEPGRVSVWTKDAVEKLGKEKLYT